MFNNIQYLFTVSNINFFLAYFYFYNFSGIIIQRFFLKTGLRKVILYLNKKKYLFHTPEINFNLLSHILMCLEKMISHVEVN